MSINDTPEIREWFGAFHIDEVRLSYTIAKTGGKKVQELIISNREARAGLL
jgi:DNA adenine methylase